ncbi:hypothetical protein OR1_00020 [Geobacter sp. OR-1]|uniref:hypothetical protein n=1 Tax=Geobacter sp. OR-1 TaxID=1266765 RepID=UPI0005419D0A|nr:hypothetical protein [Geobacter sp. OR-1]GAM07751.1 hypothetical protein OR1_00020 [Geobacter sp. OR-1]
MAIDYRERSFASKNKPRRQPIGKYLLAVVVVVIIIFAAGFIGGWSACWFKMKKTAAVQQAAVNTAPSQQAPAGQLPPLPAQPKGQQTPLTFYETLPKGGKG